jgi:hypothetical protein
MIALHSKAFLTKNICLDFIHISVHKPRGCSSFTLSCSHESLFPRFCYPTTGQNTLKYLNTSLLSPPSGLHLSWRDAFDVSEDFVFSWILSIAYEYHWALEYFICPHYHDKSWGMISNINYIVHNTHLQEVSSVHSLLERQPLKVIVISWGKRLCLLVYHTL